MSEDLKQAVIDQYDARTGWSKVADPLNGAGPNAEELKSAGFEHYASFGVDSVSGIRVYLDRQRRFLIMVDFVDHWDMFLAPDSPSMIELLGKVSFVAVDAAWESLRETMQDLHALLTSDAGPLAEAVHDRNVRRREARAKAKDE